MRKLILAMTLALVSVAPAISVESKPGAKPPTQAKTTPKIRVFVAATDKSVFKRIDDTTIQFVKGNLLVSVKPPMKSATVQTPFGVVTVPSNSVVYVSLANGELQVQHLHGTDGGSVSASLKDGLFKEPVEKPLTIGVGEHIAGTLPSSQSVTREAVPPLPTPVPTVSTLNQNTLKTTGQAVNSMAKNLPNFASRKRFAAITKTPVIDDYVNDFDFDMKSDDSASDTSPGVTSPDDVPSAEVAPADSFQTARENVQEGEFQSQARSQGEDFEDDSGLAEMFGKAQEGPLLDATGGMLEPGGGY